MPLAQYVISDFSGGLNDTNVAPLIKDNECQTATNVFVNLRGGVEKRYGSVNYTANTGGPSSSLKYSALGVYPSTNYNSLIDTIISIQGGSGPSTYGATSPKIQYITAGSTGGSWANVVYQNGTATFTNGSLIVTLATGTSEWSTQLASGDYISADGTTYYQIDTVDSNTQVTMFSAYGAATVTSAYSVSKSINTTFPIATEMFNGNLMVSPGQNGEIYYISSTFKIRRTATGPSGAILGALCTHKNYLFGLDHSGSHNGRVWWSTLLDATSSSGWPATNFVDVDPLGGGARALVSHNGLLYIFKDDGIWYLHGEVFDPANPTFSLVKVPNPQKIGTHHRDSVKSFQDKIIFLGNDGLYAVEGLNTIINLTENKIRTTFRGMTNIYNPWAGTTNAPVFAAVYDNRYWLSYTDDSSGSNNKILVMEPNGAFTIHNLFTNSNFAIANTGSKPVLLGFKKQTGGSNDTMYQVDGTAANDGSTAISSTWTSKIFSFNDFSKTTHVYDVWVAYYNTTNQAATLTVYDDNGAIGSSAAHTFPGGSTQFITVQKFTVDRDTNGLYLSVTDNTSSKSFRIMGVVIQYEKDAQGSGAVVT